MENNEKQLSFWDKFNPFSQTFGRIRNRSGQEHNLNQTMRNSVGNSENNSEILRAFKQHFNNTDDTNFGSASPKMLEDVVVSSNNKILKILKFREMENFPEISDALEYITNEAIFTDRNNKVCTMSIIRDVPIDIKRILVAEFDYITYDAMKLHENAWFWFKSKLVDSEIFLEKVLNDKQDRIISANKLNPLTTFPIKSENKILYFLQKKTSQDESYNISGNFYSGGIQSVYGSQESYGDNEYIRLNSNQVAYSNYDGGNSLFETKGYLDSALLPYNHLKNLELSLILYRVIRAPERFKFDVEMGKMPTEKGKEYLNKLKNEFRKREFFDPKTGEIDMMKNFASVLDDFWFVKRGGVGSDVSTIGGTMDLGNITDVDHFLKKLYKSLKLPQSRWGITDGSAPKGTYKPEEITFEEHKFYQMVQRLRQRFVKVVQDFYFTQLQLDGVPEEYISEEYIQIQFVDHNLFQKEKELSLINSMVETINSASGFIQGDTKFLEQEYILRKILGDDEYDKNLELRNLRKENEEMKKKLLKSDKKDLKNDKEDNANDGGDFGGFGGDNDESPIEDETPAEATPTDNATEVEQKPEESENGFV